MGLEIHHSEPKERWGQVGAMSASHLIFYLRIELHYRAPSLHYSSHITKP